MELPPYLVERSRVITANSIPAASRYVLYWMCTAIRSVENPALDAASLIARHLKMPLLIYHGLSQSYRYASDRHHTFILQAARDIQREFNAKSISYAFHLERPGYDRSYLSQLASRAAVVVTEEMPTGSPMHCLRALASSSVAPIIAVDTACVVPMQLVGKAYERAFLYRNKTKKLYAERLTRVWTALNSSADSFDLNELPFNPVDLQHASIADLVASSDIDHSVGPVIDTVGGSTAGYQRWEKFKRDGLHAYAKRRNNAVADGVSRLSAYLHYGMVSPLRIAREAAELNHAGAEKYLDELLIWRELAYTFCYYRKDHARWSGIPSWARETLLKHQTDPKPMLLSWEQLARGETGDTLWDAAQKSLLIHGELHNNVRMTWGKAILQWTRNPREALRMIIDLNHRYALDGQDPASYGGILWCFGQFDRPFDPEQAIVGSVRPRPTHQHANRLDMDKYRHRTKTPRCHPIPDIAVVGAGISGLFAARTLLDHGLPTILFEKSRGCGGRMATRRGELATFDHGAQYFTVRDARFRRYVDAWLEQGIIERWDGEIAVFENGKQVGMSNNISRYVGIPGMNAIGKHLGHSLNIHFETPVDCIHLDGEKLLLSDNAGNELGKFDLAVVATPAPQAAIMLREFSKLSEELQEFQLDPCWALMACLAKPLDVVWNGAFVNVGPLRWLARNQTKPGRNRETEAIVMHANADWTREHLKDTPEQVTQQLIAEFWAAIGVNMREVLHSDVHRWMYSIPSNPSSTRCVADDSNRIFACGDWAGGPRIEGAFLSGMSAAGYILRSLKPMHKQMTQQALV